MARVLFLCTANICRSPMAEAFLRQRSGIEGLGLKVSSAGFLAEGMPPPPEAVAAMAAFGLDTSGHRSRRCTAEDLASADLVLAMARGHVREAVVIEPEVWGRTFTLKELVRRAGGAERSPGKPLERWLDRVGAGRDRSAVLGSSDTDDVADPIGGTARMFERTAREISFLVAQIADLAWPGG